MRANDRTEFITPCPAKERARRPRRGRLLGPPAADVGAQLFVNLR